MKVKIELDDETLLMKHHYVSESTSNIYRGKLTVHNRVILRENPVIIGKVLQPEILTRIHARQLGAEALMGVARDVVYCSQGTKFLSS